MGDTITCPYCCNLPDLRPNCRACNGAGVIGMHNAPDPAPAAIAAAALDLYPSPRPAPGSRVLFVAIASGRSGLVALDMSGRVWRRERGGPGDAYHWTMLESPVEP